MESSVDLATRNWFEGVVIEEEASTVPEIKGPVERKSGGLKQYLVSSTLP